MSISKQNMKNKQEDDKPWMKTRNKFKQISKIILSLTDEIPRDEMENILLNDIERCYVLYCHICHSPDIYDECDTMTTKCCDKRVCYDCFNKQVNKCKLCKTLFENK